MSNDWEQKRDLGLPNKRNRGKEGTHKHSSNFSMPARMTTSPSKPQGILKKSSYQCSIPIKIEGKNPNSRTLKLRAPAKLPGGYRFTAQIKGLKIKATVVSSDDFS
jgi:hypothetical protein